MSDWAEQSQQICDESAKLVKKQTQLLKQLEEVVETQQKAYLEFQKEVEASGIDSKKKVDFSTLSPEQKEDCLNLEREISEINTLLHPVPTKTQKNTFVNPRRQRQMV